MSIGSTNSGESLKGVLLVVAAGCMWGTSGTLQSFAPAEATPFTVGAVRVFGAGLILFFTMMATNARAFARGPWKIWPAVVGGLSLTLCQLTFFHSVKITGAGVAAIISIGSAPAIAGIMGTMVLGEKLSLRWYLSTAIAVAGCLLLTSGGTARSGHLDLFGVALALAAGFFYSVEGVALKMYEGLRSSFEAITAVFIVSAITALPLLLTPDAAWILTPRGAVVALLLALVTSALPFALFTKGLHIIGVAKSYTLSLTEPMTAWLLSTFILHQKLAPIALVGVACIFAAVFILASSAAKRPQNNV